MTLTFGSLFAGIGGFDLGFHQTGLTCSWQVEIDQACRNVLARHWPNVPKFADVRDVGAHNLSPVDVITFGSPCQDLSVAGRRAGLGGERSGLFYEAVRVIRELRPALAIWENVPGAFSSNRGRDFGAALDALADAGALDICWRVLDAQWFGVAQRRRRLFLIADFRGERAAEILFEPASVYRDLAPSGEARQDVAGTLGGSSQSGGFRTTDLDNNGAFIPTVSAKWAKGTGGPAGDECQNLVAGTLTGMPYADKTGQESKLVVAFSSKDHGADAGTLAPTLRSMNYDKSHINGGGQIAIAFAENQRAEVLTSDVVRSITNGGGKPGQGYPAVMAYTIHGTDKTVSVATETPTAGAIRTKPPGSQENSSTTVAMAGTAVRRLTPVECERLQGFPDNWTDLPQADSTRYRQLGNAVAVPCARWIGSRVLFAAAGGEMK